MMRKRRFWRFASLRIGTVQKGDRARVLKLMFKSRRLTASERGCC